MAKNARQAISDLANGRGFLYIVDEDNDLVTSVTNDIEGVRFINQEAVKQIPLGFNISASGIVKITANVVTGNITQINIGGVNQINANILITGLSVSAVATAIQDAIKSFDPGAPNYDAFANDDIVTMQGPSDLGSTANSHTITIVTDDVALGTDITDPSGGFSVTDDTTGNTFHIDADYDSNNQIGGGTATQDTVGANAVDITKIIVPESLTSGFNIITATVNTSGAISFEREAAIMVIKVTTNGGGATDDLDTIETAGLVDQDILIVIADDPAKVVTVREVASPGNIQLDGAPTNFVLNSITKAIFLRYDKTANELRELIRTSVLSFTDTDFRDNSISIGKSGITTLTIVTGGGTDTVVPGTAAKNIILDGNSVALGSNYSLVLSSTDVITGDPFLIFYKNPVTTGGIRTITLGGVLLSDDQATKGIVAMAFYDGAAYQVKILVDAATTFVDNEKIAAGEINETKLKDQSLTPGAYTNVNITVTKEGIITLIANGSAGGGLTLANVLFVDPGGDDTAAVKGDITQPWATIATALGQASSGELVWIMPGTYDERNLLKDGVNLHFEYGAKVVYTGSSGAVLEDNGVNTFTCRFTGYPYFEHSGGGTNKEVLRLTGTGAGIVILEFFNTEFYDTVGETVLINNTVANTRVRFKDSLIRHNSTDEVCVNIDDIGKLHFDNTWIVNENNGSASHGIELAADDVVFDGARFFITHASAFSISAAVNQDIKIYGTVFSNKDVGGAGTITNLVTGSNIIFDTNFEFYR